MTTSKTCPHENRVGVRRDMQIGAIRLCLAIWSLFAVRAQAVQTPAAFMVVGSQFHRRGSEDAGQARICIRNTGEQPLSMPQLAVRVLAQKAAGPETPGMECGWVYSKLSPPVVRPGQHGEIVVKLTDAPPAGCHLTCEVSVRSGAACHTISLAEPPVWIPFVGFSKDLRRAFVYVENLGPEPTAAKLLHVGRFDVADGAAVIHSPVPPRDKGCLIGDLPSPLTSGEFVRVAITVNAGGRESRIETMVRVISAMPVVTEFDIDDPGLGLDARRPFLQTMACPAHAHGTHEQAAAKFMEDYARQFSEDPGRVIQMAICRSDMSKAWFRFGDLPDVAAVNTCLRPPVQYKRNPEAWFCPFSCVGDLAKKATEPGRFVAILPTGPAVEEGSFLLKGLTSQESRFLVYCAVACGAKGVIYRGLPASDPLSWDAFRRLNREVQHLKPLLLEAEPVDWIATESDNHAAKGLLCGDQAVLIVVFDRRYFSRERDGRFYTPPFGRTVLPVRITGKIPRGTTVQEVATPSASLARNRWDQRDGILELTVDMVDSAQVYVASIQPQADPSEERVAR